MTAINYCDTEQELNELINDFEENPDFTFIGYYQSINRIYEEMNYQGFTDQEIEQLTKNQYGNCLEIIEYNSEYTVYIGAR